MRKFFSADIPCEAGCRYCFAKWPDYNCQMNLRLEREYVGSNRIILYPCCDGDFFEQVELIESIKWYAEVYDKIYVSLSGKIKPADEQLVQLLGLNDWLIKKNKGFVKFAVSLSNRTMLDEIEPGTMTYEERIALAGYISSLGLHLSLTIKPVLPFITEEEYGSILKDFRPYLNRVLVGGLYINKESDFYKKYLNNYPNAKRRVEWLSNHPVWDYVENEEQMRKIKMSAQELGMQVFDSDFSLIKSIVRGTD